MVRLIVRCLSCESEISFFSHSTDRASLARENGEYLPLRCKKCGSQHKYDVNNVSACFSQLWNLLLVILTILSTACLVYYLSVNYWGKSFYSFVIIPMVSGIPATIYITLLNHENKKVRLFNQYRI